jgi:SagB-type dehydrogenase family enzyme
MMQAPLLSFRQGVSLGEASADRVTLEFPGGKVALTNPTPGLLAVLRALSADGAAEDQLSRLAVEKDGSAALAPLYHHLQRCGRLGLLRHTLVVAGQPLAVVEPMTGGFELHLPDIGASTRLRLSRFAFCRRDGDALALESPLSTVRTILPGTLGATLIGELARPRTYPDLCAVGGVAEDTAQGFLSLLAGAAVLAEVAEDGTSLEDADPPLALWEFHDLLFHAWSRTGRHDHAFGGTFRFLGRIAPLPALKAPMSDDVIPLHTLDVARLERDDPPFTEVLEARRSIREYGGRPITAGQLGEFLYRAGRVRRVVEADPALGRPYEASDRPYPSGGAAYDIELYVTINTCTDVPPGIYHYDPLGHRLCRLAGRDARVEALLRHARTCAMLTGEPQVLITLASRFQRLSWKYSGMAYATTLKNVGVLYHTMYLVATAMGLAPCGLGGGSAALFAEAAGLDWLAEGSVGEFLLGGAGPAR